MTKRSPAFSMVVIAFCSLGIAGAVLYILWAVPWWEAIKLLLLMLFVGCLVALILGRIRRETMHGVMGAMNMDAQELKEAAEAALKMQEGGEPEREPSRKPRKKTPAANAKTVIKD